MTYLKPPDSMKSEWEDFNFILDECAKSASGVFDMQVVKYLKIFFHNFLKRYSEIKYINWSLKDVLNLKGNGNEIKVLFDYFEKIFFPPTEKQDSNNISWDWSAIYPPVEIEAPADEIPKTLASFFTTKDWLSLEMDGEDEKKEEQKPVVKIYPLLPAPLLPMYVLIQSAIARGGLLKIDPGLYRVGESLCNRFLDGFGGVIPFKKIPKMKADDYFDIFLINQMGFWPHSQFVQIISTSPGTLLPQENTPKRMKEQPKESTGKGNVVPWDKLRLEIANNIRESYFEVLAQSPIQIAYYFFPEVLRNNLSTKEKIKEYLESKNIKKIYFSHYSALMKMLFSRYLSKPGFELFGLRDVENNLLKYIPVVSSAGVFLRRWAEDCEYDRGAEKIHALWISGERGLHVVLELMKKHLTIGDGKNGIVSATEAALRSGDLNAIGYLLKRIMQDSFGAWALKERGWTVYEVEEKEIHSRQYPDLITSWIVDVLMGQMEDREIEKYVRNANKT